MWPAFRDGPPRFLGEGEGKCGVESRGLEEQSMELIIAFPKELNRGPLYLTVLVKSAPKIVPLHRQKYKL